MVHPIERDDEKSATHLKKIAELLGCSARDFFIFDRRRPVDLEFFRLWAAIRSETDRVRALEFLKAIVADQDRRDSL